MAESRTVAIVPLKGSNYPTWKVQCRMALVKDGLWSIVNGTEAIPDEGDADARAKFVTRRDRALALIVLSVEPSLLYLLGDPEDPVVVWKKLSDQFQKKTWANKLELRRRLYSLKLREGDSVQEHIRKMIEIFEELAVIGDPVTEEDLVCRLKKSLYGLKQSPRCWNTALDQLLKEIGFVQSESDPCIYRESSGELFLLGVYVDDIVMASKNQARLKEVKKSLAKRFDIKDLGKLHHFLGIKIIQDEATGKVWVGQQVGLDKLCFFSSLLCYFFHSCTLCLLCSYIVPIMILY